MGPGPGVEPTRTPRRIVSATAGTDARARVPPRTMHTQKVACIGTYVYMDADIIHCLVLRSHRRAVFVSCDVRLVPSYVSAGTTFALV